MHVVIIGDRRARLSPGWTNETVVAVFGDAEIDATAEPGPGAAIRVFGLFGEAKVRVAAGRPVEDGGVTLLGDREVNVPPGEGGPIRIDVYGLGCDLTVVASEAGAAP